MLVFFYKTPQIAPTSNVAHVWTVANFSCSVVKTGRTTSDTLACVPNMDSYQTDKQYK